MDDIFKASRKEYDKGALDEETVHSDPFQQFRAWFDAALQTPEIEPNACAVATAGSDAKPSVRMVLLKSIDERGFVFFTGYESKKGRQILENPCGAMLFYWATLERQVRIEGTFERVSKADSDAYFASRPRNAQLGAVVSKQSAVVSSRAELEEEYRRAEKRLEGSVINRPEAWGGYRLIPDSFEFWQGRESRLHDRVRFVRRHNEWVRDRLWP